MKIPSNYIGPKQVTQEEQLKKLKDVSDLYEKQFLQQMYKAMKGSTGENGIIPVSQAEKIYTEQLDQQYIDKWSENGGVGFSDLIYKQLIDKYGPQLGIHPEETSMDTGSRQKIIDVYKK